MESPVRIVSGFIIELLFSRVTYIRTLDNILQIPTCTLCSFILSNCRMSAPKRFAVFENRKYILHNACHSQLARIPRGWGRFRLSQAKHLIMHMIIHMIMHFSWPTSNSAVSQGQIIGGSVLASPSTYRHRTSHSAFHLVASIGMSLSLHPNLTICKMHQTANSRNGKNI
jgi:hypothetical protein